MVCCTHGAYTFIVLQRLLFCIRKITLISLSPRYFTESWVQSANSLGIETDKSELQLLKTGKTMQRKECKSCHLLRNQWQFPLEKSSSISLRKRIREVSLIRKFTYTKLEKSFSLSQMMFGRVKNQIVNLAPLKCWSRVKAVTIWWVVSTNSSDCVPALCAEKRLTHKS